MEKDSEVYTYIYRQAQVEKNLFYESGNKGNQWILGQKQFEARGSFQIYIEGKTTNNQNTRYGDIAIDDIILFPSDKCPIGCRDPTPEDGFANPRKFNIGSAVQIACHAGYYMVGNPSIVCLAHGSWSGRPICRTKYCMTPTFNSGVIGNVSEGTSFNMRIILSCAVGFTLIGNAFITCQSDGKWTKQPFCVINNCSDPTPESGMVDNRNFQYGSVIKVTCIEGYKISGNSTITCQANATWNNNPVCNLIECESWVITNGHFTTTLGTTIGKIATQSCDTGYTLLGDETVTCYEGGWNGTIATCTVADSKASSLVVAYATVPVIVIVLTAVLLFFSWRKWRLKCSTLIAVKRGENENPATQENMELSTVANNYEQLNSNTMQTATVGSTLPDNEYAVLSNTENDEVVNVYYNTAESKNDNKSSVNLGYENASNFGSVYANANADKPIQLYESLTTDTQNEKDYDILNTK